ncbi:sulfotransferase domain-containing protein [Aurantiacibacter sediminis]|uniref:Sulfotransferase domain-containing protein n=1 Tax=Aurantiacibacter sediminis TaxID=2793064 RepID=A0ABS0N5U9_9SPHN|nr:sulfotransferase domain-containing protein [Aurantiacibacter sediminis]MBH5323161.1 sulfotransferase domain-containing protein [Aurantiacibacter sediminis]
MTEASDTLDKPGITWLASYPKSGNTWTRILLSNLIAPDDITDDNFAPLHGSISSNRVGLDAVSGLPSSDLTDDEIDLLRPDYYRELARTGDERQFVKVHDAYHGNGAGKPLFPADCSLGAIYLVRHPFDVAVSYASHQGHQDFAKTINHMANPAHIMAGGSKGQLRQKLLTWSEHYLTWHRQDQIPVLTIRYEDMLADTAACLTRMGRFLKLPEADDKQAIARAVEESRFEKLRAKEDEHGFRERPEKTERFFRAGRAGDGWDLLDDELRERLYTAHRDVMEELGYKP